MELRRAWHRIRFTHPAIPVTLFGVSFLFVPAIESSIELPITLAWLLAIEFFFSFAWFMIVVVGYVCDLIRSYND